MCDLNKECPQKVFFFIHGMDFDCPHLERAEWTDKDMDEFANWFYTRRTTGEYGRPMPTLEEWRKKVGK